MERSVLFFDIDGTLLSEVTHEVPESAEERTSAVYQYRENRVQYSFGDQKDRVRRIYVRVRNLYGVWG